MKIFVAGHKGMVGSAICRRLARDPSTTLLTAERSEVDLTRQEEVERFIETHLPDQIYLAAAKVGGIYANSTYPYDFILQNLQIQSNVVEAARRNGVKRLLFLGSSCIYPKFAEQPIKEECLLTGALEPTNEPYALAKIAGLKMCEAINRQYGSSEGYDYRAVMPTNLYGPGDNYHPQNSHVIPALLKRFHDAKISKAKSVTIWGTGTPRREFLYVDDLAEASVQIMNTPRARWQEVTGEEVNHVNLGTGTDLTIADLAETIRKIVGYGGQIIFDHTKPDGTPRKLLDNSRMNRLWTVRPIPLQEGLEIAYREFIARGNIQEDQGNWG